LIGGSGRLWLEFAFDCRRFAGSELGADTITLVASDQLARPRLGGSPINA